MPRTMIGLRLYVLLGKSILAKEPGVDDTAPAEVSKVVMDQDTHRIEVVVPDDQLSLAIGRRGQNVRLASQLSGWDIDIFTEAEESERRNEEFRARSALFVEALDVDDVIAHLLVTEGFSKVEEVAFVSLDDLTDIEGFDEAVAQELQARAQNYLETRDAEFEAKRKELGVDDDLGEFEGITTEMMVLLGEAGVKTRDDLADLAGDELLEIVPQGAMTLDAANDIIMQARAHWFADEEGAEGEGEGETAAEAAGGDAEKTE